MEIITMRLPVTVPTPRMSFADAPVVYATALLCLAIAVGASVRLGWLLKESRKDRIDLQARESIYTGRSWIWQENVLDRRNYRAGTGRPLVRRMLACMAVQLLALLAAFAIAFGAIL